MTHRFLALAAALAAALLTPAAPAVAAAPAPCHVGYTTHGDQWSFTGGIVITNTGPVTLYGWTLKFTLPAGQTLRTGWEADFEVSGQDVTAHARDYNRNVAPQKWVTVGFSAAGNARGPRPAEFRINGALCTSG